MSKFTFTCESWGTNNSMSFESDTWDETVEQFEIFLKGSGFVFEDGHLEMTYPKLKDDKLNDFFTTEEEVEEPVTNFGHSEYYYNYDRNISVP